MEEVEPPECPVCLQPYDAVASIPRVLTCGHTTCEACLKQLLRPFPNTLRCTVCTILVKIPNSLSALPKNLDLLHFSSTFQLRGPAKDEKTNSPSSPLGNGKIRSVLFPSNAKSWPYEFFCKWKRWVVPKECISIEKREVLKSFESDRVMGFVLREKENVGLVKVGIFVNDEEDSKLFRPSYESVIMTVMYGMEEDDRHDLSIMLNAAYNTSHVGKAYGFWLNEDDNSVYMVWQKFTSSNLTKFVLTEKDDEEERLSRDEISGLCMLGMEICEIISRVHSEGLVIGCLSVSSFGFDDFGHVCIDLSEVLNSSIRVRTTLKRASKDLQVNLKSSLLDENGVFISPEMLLLFIDKAGFGLVSENSRYVVGYASDVWSVASLLAWLIVGSSFVEEMEIFLQYVVNAIKDEKCCDYSSLYISWMEKIAELLKHRLGSCCDSLCEMLCKCLEFDPENRLDVTELWKCLRELIVKPQFDIGPGLRQNVKKENPINRILLGEMCDIVKEIDKELKHFMKVNDENDEADAELRVDRDIVEGFSSGHFKCIEMRGHLDCVTSLAVGEQPLCISGDNEGIICIWKADFPFSESPMKKIFEKKDWRFSGIHAMAVYVSNGVLFSGSWDGTVRLWSLIDHSPLTVLGEGKFGNVGSVLSLSADRDMLFVGHENGSVKIWHNDVLLKSTQTHKGAVFSVGKNGKWLFSGGWDKSINVQEISEDVSGVDVIAVGSIPCNSTITSLVYCNGKLFVAQADSVIKV
ncbi:protein translocase subunit SecA [Striga asiatica]|uniref:Protein translocase subunit SecA n=1 Tax=Striga asiatica TaxID=4170 RepID=A0A5A7PYR7_STRAF|nr:protein translocase subunit SecA [Striga asiatica]